MTAVTPPRSLKRDASGRALATGLVSALVGYASSVAVIVAGLGAMGADSRTVASGLAVAGATQAIAAIALSWRSRMPISVVWTTPGMILLAASSAPEGGLPAVLGAFLLTGLAIVATALIRPLQRLVEAIPATLASAMLAGVLLKLCLVPFQALHDMPGPGAALILIWLLAMRFWRMLAGPAVLLAAVAVTLWLAPPALHGGSLLPLPVWTLPRFDLQAALGLALPLFIVTMASQNIPGAAVMNGFGYRVPLRPAFLVTGGLSALAAPFAAPPINLAAITAALCAGPDAHPDAGRRYVAAMAGGATYLLLGLLAGLAALMASGTSTLAIEAAAGLILIPTLVGSLQGALAREDHRLAAAMTFLCAASGTSFAGVGAAFWGLLAGGAVLLLQRPLRVR